jgi:type II secretory pathway pseudopilin PulG
MNQHDNPHHPGNPDHQPDVQPYSDLPPQKERMSCWVIGCVGLSVVFSLLIVAAIPLITSGTRGARQAEGESIMGVLRNSARVAYRRAGTPPRTLTGSLEEGGAGVEPDRLQGRYYQVEDRIGAPQQGYGKLTANPTPDHSDQPTGTMTFSWDTGVTELTWD